MRKIYLPDYLDESVLLGEKEQPYGPDYTIDEMRKIKLRCLQMGQIDNAILLMTVNRSGFTTWVFSD